MDASSVHGPSGRTPRFLPPGATAPRLRERLQRLGVSVAPELSEDDERRLRDVDSVLAQVARAARTSTGSVRAYASLIDDACAGDANVPVWLGKIERAMRDLDDFVARASTLRVCESERPSPTAWNDVVSRVATRCSAIAPGTIEAVDRTLAPMRMRAELVGRALFHMVRNAIETAGTGCSVRVRLDEWRDGGLRVAHVRVSNDGPAIAPGFENDMWRPFVTTRDGHAGLGLTHVAVTARIAGGAAGSRREGDRTTFHLVLPEEGGLVW